MNWIIEAVLDLSLKITLVSLLNVRFKEPVLGFIDCLILNRFIMVSFPRKLNRNCLG
jgi:hypothetical protein